MGGNDAGALGQVGATLSQTDMVPLVNEEFDVELQYFLEKSHVQQVQLGADCGPSVNLHSSIMHINTPDHPSHKYTPGTLFG